MRYACMYVPCMNDVQQLNRCLPINVSYINGVRVTKQASKLKRNSQSLHLPRTGCLAKLGSFRSATTAFCR